MLGMVIPSWGIQSEMGLENPILSTGNVETESMVYIASQLGLGQL